MGRGRCRAAFEAGDVRRPNYRQVDGARDSRRRLWPVRAPVQGTRQGKTVLVQLRDATDPETGARYTVKRYESERVGVGDGDSWRHARITLKPNNPEFEPIVLIGRDEGEVAVVAELVEVVEVVEVSVATPVGIGEIGNGRG